MITLRAFRLAIFLAAFASATAALAEGATLEKIAGQVPRPAAGAPSPASTPAGPTLLEIAAQPAGLPARAPEARVWEPRSSGIRRAAISAIAVNPSDPRSLVTASSNGVVYRSEDGGRNWRQVLRIRRSRGQRDVESDASARGTDTSDDDEAELEDLQQQTEDDLIEELTPLVGVDEAERTAADEAEQTVEERRQELEEQNRGETDAAENDSAAAPPAATAAVRQLVWDSTFPGLVYAATRDGVWRSADSGENWVEITVGAGDEDRDDTCVAPSAGSPDRILVGTAFGLLVTNDGGISWARATGEIANLSVRAIAINPVHRSTVAVGTVSGAFLSIDGGDTFRRVYAATGQAADVRALAFGPGEGSDLYEGTANGLYVVSPEDSRPLGTGELRVPQIRAVVVPAGAPDRIYVATGKGVYESRDGGESFAELYRGLDSPDAITICEDLTGPDGLFAATTLGVFRLVPETSAVAAAPERIPGPAPTELLRAAATYGNYDADRVAAWRHDARWSTLLPIVTAEYRNQWQNDRTTGFTEVRDVQGVLIARDPAGDSFPWNRNDMIVVTFSWSFDELLAGSRVTRVMQQVAQVGRSRNQKLTKVARLARERKDVAGRLAAGIADAEERLSATLRLQELDAYLDAATGGAITNSSRSIRRPR